MHFDIIMASFTALIAGMTALIAAVAKLWNPIKEMRSDLSEIKKEVKINGGLSVKDKVNDIALKIDYVSQGLIDLSVDVDISNFQNEMMLSDTKKGIFKCDSNGFAMYVNQYLATMFGLEKSEMIGTGWLSAIHENDRKDAWEKWMYCKNNNIPYSDEYRVVNKITNEVYSCIAKTTAHTDRKGNKMFYGTVERVG